MDEVKNLNTIDEIKAFSDPYRLQILNCINKFGEPVTVKQIADDLGEVPAKIHYHVKKLESVGILLLAHTREVNGIVAKYYEPTAKRFIINRPDLNPGSLGEALTETQKTITAAYGTSRSIFLEHMDEKNFVSDKEKKGSLSMSSLYLTQEEYLEFLRYIEDFCEKHEKKARCKGTNEYHFFSSIIRVK